MKWIMFFSFFVSEIERFLAELEKSWGLCMQTSIS